MTAALTHADFTTADDDVALVREQARSWAAKDRPVAAFRALRERGVAGERDIRRDQALAAMGWLGAIVPEANGGSGLGLAAGAGILLEIAHTLAVTPLAAQFAATSMIACAGSAEQKDRWLPGLADGSTLAAVAPPRALGARHTDRLHLSRTGEGWTLDGALSLVAEADMADLILVTVEHDGEAMLVVVDTHLAGVHIEECGLLDSRAYGNIVFDSTVLQRSAALVGKPDPVSAIIDRGAILAAAEIAGIARECFERTLGHLKTREQFGQLIGNFQALQHRAVSMFEAVELLEPTVLAAAGAVDRPAADPANVACLASTAKRLANDTMRLVGRDMIQLHGGMGMTDEHDIGLYLKRGRALELSWGTTAYHQDRYARIRGF